MREGAKKRLAGAVVLVTLVVIFVPMLFEDRTPPPSPSRPSLPPTPELNPSQLTNLYTPPPPADAGLRAAEPDLKSAEPGELVSSYPSEPAAPLTFEPIQEPTLPPPPPQTPTPAPRPAAQTPPRTTNTTNAAPAKPASPPPKPASASPPKPASTQTSRAEATAKAETPAKTETPVALPEPPKSRASGMPSWVVQVSSLNSPEAAAKLADKLKQSGFSAFVERAEVGGKTYYRVRVGPDSDRASAERTAGQLREQHKLETLIQRYP